MSDSKEQDHIDWFLNSAKENYFYTKDEVALIDAIQKSADIANHEKMTFGLMLINYGIEQLRVRNLEDRLQLSYKGEGIESYLNKIVQFNPKLGYVSLDAGISGRDEKDDYSCYFKIPIQYSEDIDEYFKSAKEVEDKLKQVLRIILVDAKKMRI
jgi:hypothetical protein